MMKMMAMMTMVICPSQMMAGRMRSIRMIIRPVIKAMLTYMNAHVSPSRGASGKWQHGHSGASVYHVVKSRPSPH